MNTAVGRQANRADILINDLRHWRTHSFLYDGRVHHIPALKLMKRCPTAVASCVVFDPPVRYGIGTTDDDDRGNIEEAIDAMRPLATQCMRVLKPGGITVMIGSPRTASAWELAAEVEGLRLQGELAVLWKIPVDKRHHSSEQPALASVVRWHARPGYRLAPAQTIHMQSNVVVCEEVAESDRIDEAIIQRPVSLFVFLFSHLLRREDALILDPFCGTASAMVAAHQVGKRAVGSDIDKDAVVSARERLRMSDCNTELETQQKVWWWVNGNEIPIDGS